MYRLIKFYNQNRKKVWTTILIIVFAFIMLRLFNYIAKKELEEERNRPKETTSNVVSYANESKSIISGGKVSDKYKDDFGEIIDQFFSLCINHEYQKAYYYLSSDCKKLLYQSEDLFESLYCTEKFEGDKQYSFQSWTSHAGTFIYQVKIFDNMLSSGKKNDEYIEDYITIVPEEDTYKLNINSYIKRNEISKKASNDILTLEVGVSDVYLDYEIYTFRIKNNTNNKIILDTRKKTDTTYITDDLGNNFEALLYENKEEDLIFEPQQSKTIQIKFSNAYRDGIKIKQINFTNIVKYQEYLQDENVEKSSFKLEL